MASFKYKSLDLERPTIRLLKLLKAKSSRDYDIKCELIEASFDKDDLIPYEALSYYWGGTILSASVELDGKTLAITENLHVALLALRSTEDRILWVDAVCIDQSNLKERGHQVQQMAKIYSQADRVVIWLGESTSDTNMLLECLKRLEKECTKHACSGWSNTDKRWIDIWLPIQLDIFLDYSNSTYRLRQGLADLMARTWFTRIWILQEAAYAKRAIVCCGNESVSARIFTLAGLLLDSKISAHCQAVLDIMPGPSRKTSWWNSRRDLYTLLTKFQFSNASDPRDMIFALLGMCSDSQERDAVTVDYTKDLLELVSDVAKLLFGLSDCQIDTIPALLAVATTLNTKILQQMIMLEPIGRVKQYLISRGDEIILTEAIIADVAANTSNGLDILKLFQEMQREDFKVTQAVITAATANTVQGRGMIELFLDVRDEELESVQEPSQNKKTSSWARRHNFTITEAVIVAAVNNLTQGREMIQLFGSREEDFSISAKVLACVLQSPENGQEVMKVLFSREQYLQVLQAAAQYADMKQLRFPDMWNLIFGEESITADIIIAVIRFTDENWVEGEEFLKSLLTQPGNELQITEEMLIAAAQCPTIAEEILELIFTLRDSEIILSEAIVRAATENYPCAYMVMKFLIRKRRESIMVTESVLAGAAGNLLHGEKLMRLLFPLRQDRSIHIPELVLEAAAKNHLSGVAVLEFLKTMSTITVTENVLRASISNEKTGHRIMEMLSTFPGSKIEFTSDCLETVAANERWGYIMMKRILEFPGSKIKFKGALLKATVTNEGSGNGIQETPVAIYRNEFEVTSRVLEAAAGNIACGNALIHLLLDVDGSSAQISDAVFIAAAGNTRDGEWITSLLLSARGNNITISNAIVQAAKANTRCGREVLAQLRAAETSNT